MQHIMDDWKLHARAIVRLKKETHVFVYVFVFVTTLLLAS